jgi:hypothetical protein
MSHPEKLMDLAVVAALVELLKGYLLRMRRNDGNPVRDYLTAEVTRLRAEERRLLGFNKLDA